jgi:PTH1 family peptidyl-tRNA hydrolase
MSRVTIIVGLGNPGEKFTNTRHNVGFMALDAFREKNNFLEFEISKKYHSEISEGTFGEEKVLLVKPQTFMNDSGKAVKAVAKNQPEATIVVVHDDIDLPVGKIKIIKERGSAGHKGVESIIQSIGNDGLVRFRIGIGQTKQTHGLVDGSKAIDVVLKKFSPTEQQIIDDVLQKTTSALELFISKGLDATMNEFNK